MPGVVTPITPLAVSGPDVLELTRTLRPGARYRGWVGPPFPYLRWSDPRRTDEAVRMTASFRWGRGSIPGAMGDIGKPIRETDRPEPVRVPVPEPAPPPPEPKPAPEPEPVET
jgi:hypothetical protein